MNQNGTSIGELSAAKMALLARQARLGVGDYHLLNSEPIAIVGMACRFPGGASSPDRFWDMLINGIDAIREVPQDRWNLEKYFHPDPAMPGRTVMKYGGFLERVDLFDPEFFGIAPREVARMDPQHRFFLETAYEALWDAGQTARRLGGSRTGVFLAEYYNDYLRMQLGDASRIEAYTLSGTAHSLSVGRLSYLLNLLGPSMVVDSACSSSLVTVHLACQSLRAGESDMALAGGVSVIIRPEENIPLSKWGLLAPDGRCKTFDSRADGFVRGEGCGVIVLKRLSDAISDGDRIHAVIRGTAVNQDGRSTFLSAPNGLSQQAVVRAALKNARLDASRISYVEAHGTGTKLGDPIEVEALAEVVGQPRPEGDKCLIGSVKTNIGHLEAASGIAGLIKTVLCLLHEKIPPHLHFRKLNPHIDLTNSSLAICPEGAPWPAGSRPRYAGVSSFGFGGTNAHVVLEEAPRIPLPQVKGGPGVRQDHLLPISARTLEGLDALARSYRTFLGPDGVGRNLILADICYTAGARRDHLEYRASFIASTHAEMYAQMEGFLNAGSGAGVKRVTADKARPAFQTQAPAEDVATDLKEVGSRYEAGQDVRWDVLYPNGRIVSLPAYPWQRQRYWIQEPAGPAQSAEMLLPETPHHPLLGRRIDSPFMSGLAFEAIVGSRRPAFIVDHRIYGHPVMPAAAYIEVLLAAVDDVRQQMAAKSGKTGLQRSPIVIENLTIHEPLLLGEEGHRRMQTGFSLEDETAGFQIVSQPMDEGAPGDWQLHISGKLTFSGDPALQAKIEASRIALRNALEGYPRAFAPEKFYQTLASAGIDFGPSFQGMASIRSDRSHALGRIRMTDPVLSEADRYRFHPAWLDACLQAFGALLPHAEEGGEAYRLFVPIMFQRLIFLAAPVGSLWSHVHLRQEKKELSQLMVGDAQIFNENGDIVALLEGVSLMAAQPEKMLRRAAGTPKEWLYRIRWQSQHSEEALSQEKAGPVRPGKWLILADTAGIADGLKARLRSDGAECFELQCGSRFRALGRDGFEVDPSALSDFNAVFQQLPWDAADGGWGIVTLWGIVTARETSSPVEAQEKSCGALLHLVQALQAKNGKTVPRLWIATRGAMDVTGVESIDPLQAPMWGLGGVLSLELPELQCTRIDLDPEGSKEEGVEALYREIRSGSTSEARVAFRKGERLVSRLVALDEASQVDPGAVEASVSRELRTADSGLIEELSYHPVERHSPARGEIEIEVESVGLNFRDVLNALKALPGMEMPLGGECSGRVARVGAGVENFHAGDEVLAFAFGAFRSFVTIPAQFAIAKPEALTFDEAASIPVVFLTAHYGLRHLAGLAAGQRVLIHAAAGGVGLAAVQICQRIGAEIFATAGSQEKREFLRALGVPHVMDSRSPDFADEVAAKVGDAGIDVVLNSLSGEMIPRSLSVLRPGGHFLEIGKRDIWDAAQVARFKEDISYLPFDLGQVALSDPDLLQSMLQTLIEEFRSGVLKPIRTTVFETRNTADAFQTMARAKHIGKLVISFGGQNLRSEKHASTLVRRDGSYLVTGGLGALGLEVARWLCERGAKHLVLVGRRAPAAAANKALEKLRALDVRIEVLAADVAQRGQVDRLIETIRRDMPPLRGIVHAAGVIDDGLLLNQTWQRFVNVMAPKIDGAWNLHLATEGMALDFFVMFSSVASILGWQGQGAYAAGNAFMDALAHYRRRRGLAALSINWGPWAGTGMAAGLESTKKRRIETKGLQTIEADEALLSFQRMLALQAAQLVALKVDWPQFSREFPDGIGPSFFDSASGSRAMVSPSAAKKASDLLERLGRLPSGERREFLAEEIERQAGAVLGIASGKRIERHQSLHDVGLDSLMAVELRNTLCQRLNCTLTPTVLFDYPTIETLVNYLADQVLDMEMGGREPSGMPEAKKDGLEEDIAHLKEISDAEAEALLEEELKRLAKDN
jgi:acyl transferase domain-containing protein/NAD(P)-dependent dehydrogenase (short-subunit alcohol dehydrogenase family)/acyl carrier protein